MDIVENNKKVSLTVKGTLRTGKILGPISDHTQGGWLGKTNWSCRIVLE